MNLSLFNWKFKEKNIVFFHISIIFTSVFISIFNWFFRYIYIQRFPILEYFIIYILVVLFFFFILNNSSVFRNYIFSFLLSNKLKDYFLFIKKFIPYDSKFTLSLILIFFYFVEYYYFKINSLSLYVFIIFGSLIRVYFFTPAFLYNQLIKSNSLNNFIQNSENSRFFIKSSTIIHSPTPLDYELALKIGGPQLLQKLGLGTGTILSSGWAVGDSTVSSIKDDSKRIVDSSSLQDQRLKTVISTLEEKKNFLNIKNPNEYNILNKVKQEKIDSMIARANGLRHDIEKTCFSASTLTETVSSENKVLLGLKEIGKSFINNPTSRSKEMLKLTCDYNYSLIAIMGLERELETLDLNNNDISVPTLVEKIFSLSQFY